MSSSKDTKDSKSREAKDLEILITAWKTSKVAPVVDYQALADAGHWKNTSTAQVSFGNLRRRLFGADWKPNVGDGGAAGPSTPTKKSGTPRKRKGKAAADEETVRAEDGASKSEEEVKAEGDGEPMEKKAKKAAKGKAKVKKEATQTEDEVEEIEREE